MSTTRFSKTLLTLVATGLLAGGCGDETPDALEDARQSIEESGKLIEEAVKDEKISEDEAREICESSAALIPDESAAEDAVEICVEATLGFQGALGRIDTDGVKEQLKNLDSPLP